MGVRITAAYTGNLKCTATHGPSGVTLRTAAPVDNMGDGSSFSPTDLLATALATCVVTTMAIAAKKHGVDFPGAMVEVEKVMSADAPRRIARLPVTLTMPPGVPPELRDRLEAAARTCPVHRSLHADVDAPITIRWSG